MYDFADRKIIVVKVGTSTLTYPGGGLNLRRVSALTRVLSDLKNSGIKPVLVTSGAVGLGANRLGLTEKPSETRKKQACAAIGQCELMNYYGAEFAKYNHTAAQVLLTRNVIANSTRRENAANTLAELLGMGVVPVINANDAVSVKYLDFDENDTLSAIAADLAKAELLIMLTDVDGLYDRNPADPEAKFIPLVRKITPEIISSAGGAGSAMASGGMLAKLEAAALALEKGIPSVIANGDNPSVLYDIIEGTAVCTAFIQ